MAGERAAAWGATQLYLIVAGAMLGPAALGGLKAAQGLVVGPTSVVLNGAGSFGLPEATRQFAERGWTGMIRVSRFVTGAGASVAAVCAVAVLVAAPTFLRLLYGPEFVTYAPSARIFAISVAISALGVGPTLTLTTTRRVIPLVIVQLAKLICSVALTFVLGAAWGVTGVATANLVTCAVAVVAMWTVQSRVRRSVERTEQTSGAQPASKENEVKKVIGSQADEVKKVIGSQADEVNELLECDGDEVQNLLDALEGELKKLLDAVEEG